MKNKVFSLWLCIIGLSVSVLAQNDSNTFSNPIIPGFHPDPLRDMPSMLLTVKLHISIR